MYKETAFLIKEIIGNNYLYFDKALLVKKTPHDIHSVSLWGATVDPKGNIWVMDANQDWYELNEDETPIVQSLYQRISIIYSNYKQAS